METPNENKGRDGSEAFAALLASLSEFKESSKSENQTNEEDPMEISEPNAKAEHEHKETKIELRSEEPGLYADEDLKDTQHPIKSEKKDPTAEDPHKKERFQDNGTKAKEDDPLENGDKGEKRKRDNVDDDWKPGSGYSSGGNKKIKTIIKKKPRASPKKHALPDNKLSFQEAAVRVLMEQRQKGVYALSTRKIWELIAQAGLVDTKCKTPVSSLSSRITEDVRTKGNKSVFVRVGEGLYTLRKGMKKSDLEKFLNAKYPHMNHTLDGDIKLSDYPEELDEEDEEGEEESPEDDVEDEREEVEPHPPEEKKLTSPNAPVWSGLPLKVKSNGDIYYSAVTVGNHKYRIGDCAYFTPNTGDQHPYIGQVVKLWQSQSYNHNKDKSCCMYVQSVWYYYPDDTQLARSKKFHPEEVFLSDLSDVNTVDNLIGPVEVLSFAEYNKRINSSSSPKKESNDVYFCRSFYSENTRSLHPLQMDCNGGNFTIEGKQFTSKLPKNWPSHVEYNCRLIWRNLPEMLKEHLHYKCLPFIQIAPRNNNQNDFGVFAVDSISQGVIVGNYSGYLKMNNDTPSHDSSGNSSSAGTHQSKYSRVLYEDEEVSVSVDSSASGNELRFVNECTADQKPNVKFVTVQLDGKWHLLLVTTTTIEKGQELLCAKDSRYWREASYHHMRAKRKDRSLVKTQNPLTEQQNVT